MRGEDNWTITPELQWNFIPPLEWAEEAFTKCKAFQGVGKVTGLHHITREDLASIILNYDEDKTVRADLFNLGTYFNQYGPQIMTGVLPTKQFTNDPAMTYRQNLLLVIFVQDFNAIFDSTNVIEQVN